MSSAPTPLAPSDLRALLLELYEVAEAAHTSKDYEPLRSILGADTFDIAQRLGDTKHAARGVALTLCSYKCLDPAQDIRSHKSDQPGGFSARTFDAAATVPFLHEKSLPYNVETHWLSQTFSFASQYLRGLQLKTNPKNAGLDMVELVNRVQEASGTSVARAVTVVLLTRLIEQRNRGKVALEKPKDLTIDQIIEVLQAHFHKGYSRNTPRLPQLAIYAMYRCIIGTIARYEGMTLQPLERMKTANRKSGSVGDVDVNYGEKPFEAVEVKFEVPISRDDVGEAIQKIKTASVERYFILGTAGTASSDREIIRKLQSDFKRANGCEIIVDSLLETIRRYLRLVRSANTFVFEYTTLVETDADLDYEHRLAWNEICATLIS